MTTAVGVALLASATLVSPNVSDPAAVLAPRTENQTALPYRAWTARGYGVPSTALSDRAPLPLGEEPEAARRMIELAPQLAVVLPTCADGETSCARLLPGVELGVSALYRIAPNFAFGLVARMDAFSLTHADALEKLRASATFFGLLGRLYAYESGLLDPYLELALGGGTLQTKSQGPSGRVSDQVDFASALRLAVGLDFVVTPWLRFGPTLAFSRYAPASATHCTGQDCGWLPAARSSIVLGTTSLGLHWTFAAGERL